MQGPLVRLHVEAYLDEHPEFLDSYVWRKVKVSAVTEYIYSTHIYISTYLHIYIYPCAGEHGGPVAARPPAAAARAAGEPGAGRGDGGGHGGGGHPGGGQRGGHSRPQPQQTGQPQTGGVLRPAGAEPEEL